VGTTVLRNRPCVRIIAGLVTLMSGVPFAVVDAQGCTTTSTIVADRPGFLSGPSVLAKGSVQFESGWAMSRTSGNTAQTIGPSLLRIPLNCRAELRVASGGYVFDHAPSGASISGMADGYLGTKLRLVRGSGLRPHLAVFAGSSIPVGGAFSHGRAEPEGDVSALWDLPKGQWVLGYLGLASRVAGDGRENERIAGGTWGIPLGAKAGTFVEVAEFARHDTRSRFVTTGLQVFPFAALQVDGFVTVPVAHAGSNVAVGVGVARRW